MDQNKSIVQSECPNKEPQNGWQIPTIEIESVFHELSIVFDDGNPVEKRQFRSFSILKCHDMIR